MAAERHFWLSLSEIKGLSLTFHLDALLWPPGLFSDAVNTVDERFQKAKKQAETFKRYLPRRPQPTRAAGHEQPQPSSSSYRAQQKESVATCAPPQKS